MTRIGSGLEQASLPSVDPRQRQIHQNQVGLERFAFSILPGRRAVSP
jgi:hypothetical protein